MLDAQFEVDWVPKVAESLRLEYLTTHGAYTGGEVSGSVLNK